MYKLILIALIIPWVLNANIIDSKYVPENYQLITSSEFNNDLSDNQGNKLWSDKYLAHWTETGIESDAKYSFDSGVLRLSILEDQEPWDPKYDGQTIISGIQTANKDLLHRWNDSYPKISFDVPSPQNKIEYHLQKYGYFELRAKPYKNIHGGGVHSAWWMIGFQEDSNAFIDQILTNGILKPRTIQAGEVDIFEILGRDTISIPSAFHAWGGHENIKWEMVSQLNIDTAEDFHTYGFLWTPTDMKLYLDGKLIAKTNNSIHYPMLTLLGLYEKRDISPEPWTGILTDFTYPKYFDIDYWRVYLPNKMINHYNEAEHAKLSNDSVLKYNIKANNNYVVSNLGKGNYLEFKYIYVYKDGIYNLDIYYFSDEDKSLFISTNNTSEKETLLPSSYSKQNFVSQKIYLHKGFNSIRLNNNTAEIPDIDFIYIN